jgi:hypothetical protein
MHAISSVISSTCRCEVVKFLKNLNQNKMKTATNTMREHASKQYEKLLLEYDVLQIDDEYLDGMIEELVPMRVLNAIANDQGKAIWGLHPIIKSERVTAKVLEDIVRHLDAIVEWCDAGNEFDYYCQLDETTGKIRYTGDNEDWYSDGDGNMIYVNVSE